jgi:hypothetical protein
LETTIRIAAFEAGQLTSFSQTAAITPGVGQRHNTDLQIKLLHN